MKKEDLKRYLISSLITFLSAFLMSMGLQIQDMSPEAITGSAIIGVLLTASRLGIKAVAELIVSKK